MSQPETGKIRMTSADIAAGRVERLIEIERRNVPAATARQKVARRIGVTVSAVEDLLRGRMKRIPHDTFLLIRGAIIGALNAEIARANHELQMALQCGLEPHSAEMEKLKASVQAAQELINSTN